MKLIQSVLITASFLFMPLFAQAGDYRWARVVDVDPVREWVRVPVNQEVCWTDEGRYPRRHHQNYRHNSEAANIMVGSILGGVIGNQFGKGQGKDAATVAGALLGAAIASDNQKYAPKHGQKHSYRHRDHHYDRHPRHGRQQCRTERKWVEEERVTGYEVTYRFKGETYRTIMDHDPGHRVRVRMHLSLAE